MDISEIAFKRHLACLASLQDHKLAVEPTKLTGIQLIDKLVQIEDHVPTIYVSTDKPTGPKSKDQVSGLDLFLSSDLAFYSCIAKASAAQTARPADQNYPEAYASQQDDIYMAGIHTLFVSPDARYVISPASDLLQRYWHYATPAFTANAAPYMSSRTNYL